jgi:hypothetical protein
MGIFKKKKKEYTEKWYQNQLGINNGMLYPHDEVVEMLLNKCIPYGIRNIVPEIHLNNILFNNDIEFRFWDSNRYYAWMSQGHFKDMQSDKIIYSWHETLPSAKNMWILTKLIAEWYGRFVSREEGNLIHENILKTLDKFAPKDIIAPQDIINKIKNENSEH